jgi:hypothetical protein
MGYGNSIFCKNIFMNLQETAGPNSRLAVAGGNFKPANLAL